MQRRTLYVTVVCLLAAVSFVNVAFAGQPGIYDFAPTIDNHQDLAEYQATLPLYPTAADEPESVSMALTIDNCLDLAEYQATLPVYGLTGAQIGPDQALATIAPLTIDNCLDLANYQATLPHHQ